MKVVLSILVVIGGMFFNFWVLHVLPNGVWYAAPTMIVLVLVFVLAILWAVAAADDY